MPDRKNPTDSREPGKVPPRGQQQPKRDWAKYFPIDREYDRVREFNKVPSQLVVFVGMVSNDTLDNWVDKLKKKIAELNPDDQTITTLSYCSECNDSLVLLGGAGMEAYVKAEAAAKGPPAKPAPGATGEEDGIYYSANYIVDVPKKIDDTLSNQFDNKGNVNEEPKPGTVNVAVLDTGLTPLEVVDQYLIHNTHPCMAGGTTGWNFVTPGTPYADDHPEQHGSNVTRLVLDKCRKYTEDVRIIPAKIHNQDGKCDLYSMMCALAYSANMGAHIINASFGYYAPLKHDGIFCVEIFREFIKEVLTKKDILLIAAAGNIVGVDEVKDFYNLPDTPPSDLRDLDQINFYPASFSNDPELWNVISVTTVEKNLHDVVPTQNYSVNVVDIGVPADDAGNGFVNARVPGSFVKGSSFATPIVTGIIAGNYAKLAGIRDKQQLIKQMMRIGLVVKKKKNIRIRYAMTLNRKRTLLEIILSWFF